MLRAIGKSDTLEVSTIKAWQILTGAALFSQPITYTILAKRLGKTTKEVSSELKQIRNFCKAASVPDLSVIVVKEWNQRPGSYSNKEPLDEQQKKVFKHNWHEYYSPMEADLRPYRGKETGKKTLVA